MKERREKRETNQGKLKIAPDVSTLLAGVEQSNLVQLLNRKLFFPY
mgnify:CR=1 FL=1